MNKRDQSGRYWGTIGVLFLFGITYNALISRLNREGVTEGNTWLSVVIGTTATLIAAIPLIGPHNVRILFDLFGASGTPMILGDIGRAALARHWFQHSR